MNIDRIMALPLNKALNQLNKPKGMKFHESLSLYRLWQAEKVNQVKKEVGLLGYWNLESDNKLGRKVWQNLSNIIKAHLQSWTFRKTK